MEAEQEHEWIAPFVHYQCPCWYRGVGDGNGEEGNHNDTGLAQDAHGGSGSVSEATARPLRAFRNSAHVLRPFPAPRSRLAQFAYLPLSRLYFCEECNELRCPRCVQEEIVCYYCPNCLFEAPSAAVRAERNLCTRNCFECPVCCSSMQVVGSEPPSGAQVTATQSPYYLSCPFCRWHSKEIGLEFEKPNWLSSVVQKLEETKADFAEFEKLSEHYSAHLKSILPLSKATSHYSPAVAGSPSSRHDSPYLQHHYQRMALAKQHPDIPRYEPVTLARTEDVDAELLSEMMSEIDVTKVSTLHQRLRQFDDQHCRLSQIRPRRIHLRKKNSKRCRSCRHLIVKPEAKGQSTRFRIKMVALDYIPTVTLSRLPKMMTPGKLFTVVLTFTNPLYQTIHVRLSLPAMPASSPDAEDTDDVVLTVPDFSVAPYSDVWEYEQVRDAGASGFENLTAESRSQLMAPDGIKDGIVEKKGNATSVLVEVVSRRKSSTKGIVFPLLVGYSYDPDENESPTEKNAGTAEGTDGSSALTAARKLPQRLRSQTFWLTIGIGCKSEE